MKTCFQGLSINLETEIKILLLTAEAESDLPIKHNYKKFQYSHDYYYDLERLIYKRAKKLDQKCPYQ